MAEILLKALSFILIIALGYILKHKGFFAPQDPRVVSNIVLNITFPAAIINSFAAIKLELSLFSIILIGLLCNILMFGLGYLLARRKDEKTQALFMLNVAGFNIGMFTIPFIQNFLGIFGVAITSLFDIGNAIMVTGGGLALVAVVLKRKEAASVGATLRILRSSMPFVTYMLMLLLSVLQVKIPSVVTAVTGPIGAANPFLAMLMVGLLLEIRADRERLNNAAKIITARLVGAVVLAAVIFYLLPFSFEVRRVLVLVVFSPLSGIAPMMTQRSGADSGVSSLVASITVIISMVIMTGLLMFLGTGTPA